MVPVLGIDPSSSGTMRFLYKLPGSCALFKVSKRVQVDVNDVIDFDRLQQAPLAPTPKSRFAYAQFFEDEAGVPKLC